MQMHGRYKEHSGLLNINLIQDKFFNTLISRYILIKKYISKKYINTFSAQYKL